MSEKNEELIVKNEELGGMRFRYRSEEEMKDSGVEWLGKIPREWGISKMKHLLSVDITDGPHETPKLVQEGIPFLSAEAIVNSKISIPNMRGYITQEQYDMYAKKSKVYKDDILFCKSGSTTGKSAIVENSDIFGIWSPLAIIRADREKINFKNLFYVIQSNYFRTQVENYWTFGTQPNIGMQTLENLYIPFVKSKKEQEKLVSFLDEKIIKFDSIISKKEALIERLEEAKKSLISEVVTGKVKVVKTDGGYELVERSMGEMKDSGVDLLGVMPSTWKVTPLKYVAKISGGFAFSSDSFKDEGIQIIKIANLYNNKLSLERQPNFVEERYLKTHKEFIATKGDILISLTGTLGKRDYGYSILIENSEKFLVNQRVGKITFNDKLTTNYGIYVLQSEEYLSKLYSLPSGTKQANLSNEQVLSIRIPLPKIDEQERIASYLNYKIQKVNRIKDNIIKQIEKLKEAKQSLISEAVTGKIEILE